MQPEQSEDDRQAEGVTLRWNASLKKHLQQMDKIRSAAELQGEVEGRSRHLRIKNAYHAKEDARTRRLEDRTDM